MVKTVRKLEFDFLWIHFQAQALEPSGARGITDDVYVYGQIVIRYRHFNCEDSIWTWQYRLLIDIMKNEAWIEIGSYSATLRHG